MIFSAFLISSLVKYGILAVLEEAGALVVAEELDERGRVRLPVRRKALEVLEGRVDAGLSEEDDRVLGVLVEVGVEDALVHEPGVVIEEDPAQVVELERRETCGFGLERLREPLAVAAHRLRRARLDVRDDREAVASGGLREDGPYFPFSRWSVDFGMATALGFDLHTRAQYRGGAGVASATTASTDRNLAASSWRQRLSRRSDASHRTLPSRTNGDPRREQRPSRGRVHELQSVLHERGRATTGEERSRSAEHQRAALREHHRCSRGRRAGSPRSPLRSARRDSVRDGDLASPTPDRGSGSATCSSPPVSLYGKSVRLRLPNPVHGLDAVRATSYRGPRGIAARGSGRSCTRSVASTTRRRRPGGVERSAVARDEQNFEQRDRHPPGRRCRRRLGSRPDVVHRGRIARSTWACPASRTCSSAINRAVRTGRDDVLYRLFGARPGSELRRDSSARSAYACVPTGSSAHADLLVATTCGSS